MKKLTSLDYDDDDIGDIKEQPRVMQREASTNHSLSKQRSIIDDFAHGFVPDEVLFNH